MDAKAEFEAKFAGLREQFRVRCRVRSQALEQALETDNTAVIRQIAHQIAGSAGLFGYPELAEIAQRVCTPHRSQSKELMSAARALSQSLQTIASGV